MFWEIAGGLIGVQEAQNYRVSFPFHSVKTLFVDANSGGGGDSNSGTMTSPFKTTTEAVDAGR